MSQGSDRWRAIRRGLRRGPLPADQAAMLRGAAGARIRAT